jgi:hypothetical protein
MLQSGKGRLWQCSPSMTSGCSNVVLYDKGWVRRDDITQRGGECQGTQGQACLRVAVLRESDDGWAVEWCGDMLLGEAGPGLWRTRYQCMHV